MSSTSFAQTWNGRIFLGQTGQEITNAQLIDDLASSDVVVLGEKHYTPAIQQAQGLLIDETMSTFKLGTPFLTAWEFLDFSSQPRISDLYHQFFANMIDVNALLFGLMGSSNSMSYAPIFEATKKHGGGFLGVNLTREQKAPILQGGLEAVDQNLIPPGFEMGGANYYARFEEAMGGGHATPDQVQRYFIAQCLTDDVIAYHLLNDLPDGRPVEKRFLIEGSFHTDYLDGTVARIKVRAPAARVHTVSLVDASDYSESELLELLPTLLNDPQYGPLGDSIFFVNEPSR
ncbi:ChaN family lipoprotein [Bdellovibrionota bacterium FG-2]